MLKFTKHFVHRNPFWFSGIYKISKFTDSKTNRPYYTASYLVYGRSCWGDFVNKKTPHYPTIKSAKEACDFHSKNYEAKPSQIKQAVIAKAAWLEV